MDRLVIFQQLNGWTFLTNLLFLFIILFYIKKETNENRATIKLLQIDLKIHEFESRKSPLALASKIRLCIIIFSSRSDKLSLFTLELWFNSKTSI